MRSWIIPIIIIVVCALSGFGYLLYAAVSEPLSERQEKALDIAYSETNLTDVINIDYYHGRRSFQVIEGIDDAENEIYVWIEELDEEDEEAEPQIFTRLKEDGLTKQEVRSIVSSRLNISELKSIKLGIIGSTPVYEVTYSDQVNRHSFYYITFEEGTYIRHYQFRES